MKWLFIIVVFISNMVLCQTTQVYKEYNKKDSSLLSEMELNKHKSEYFLVDVKSQKVRTYVFEKSIFDSLIKEKIILENYFDSYFNLDSSYKILTRKSKNIKKVKQQLECIKRDFSLIHVDFTKCNKCNKIDVSEYIYKNISKNRLSSDGISRTRISYVIWQNNLIQVDVSSLYSRHRRSLFWLIRHRFLMFLRTPKIKTFQTVVKR